MKHPIKHLWQGDDFVAFLKSDECIREEHKTSSLFYLLHGAQLDNWYAVRIWIVPSPLIRVFLTVPLTGLMSENAPQYRRELCRRCHYSPWTTYILFDILGPPWRLLWKANLLTTGHLFPQALECRSSGCLQTLAAGPSSPRWTVKTLHTMCTLHVLTCQPP